MSVSVADPGSTAAETIKPSEGVSVVMGSISLGDEEKGDEQGGDETKRDKEENSDGGTTAGAKAVSGNGIKKMESANVGGSVGKNTLSDAQKRRNRIKQMQKVAQDLSTGAAMGGASRSATLDEHGFLWLYQHFVENRRVKPPMDVACQILMFSLLSTPPLPEVHAKIGPHICSQVNEENVAAVTDIVIACGFPCRKLLAYCLQYVD